MPENLIGSKYDIFNVVIANRKQFHASEDSRERPAVVGVEKPAVRAGNNLYGNRVASLDELVGYIPLRHVVGAAPPNGSSSGSSSRRVRSFRRSGSRTAGT